MTSAVVRSPLEPIEPSTTLFAKDEPNPPVDQVSGVGGGALTPGHTQAESPTSIHSAVGLGVWVLYPQMKPGVDVENGPKWASRGKWKRHHIIGIGTNFFDKNAAAVFIKGSVIL